MVLYLLCSLSGFMMVLTIFLFFYFDIPNEIRILTMSGNQPLRIKPKEESKVEETTKEKSATSYFASRELFETGDIVEMEDTAETKAVETGKEEHKEEKVASAPIKKAKKSAEKTDLEQTDMLGIKETDELTNYLDIHEEKEDELTNYLDIQEEKDEGLTDVLYIEEDHDDRTSFLSMEEDSDEKTELLDYTIINLKTDLLKLEPGDHTDILSDENEEKDDVTNRLNSDNIFEDMTVILSDEKEEIEDYRTDVLDDEEETEDVTGALSEAFEMLEDHTDRLK